MRVTNYFVSYYMAFNIILQNHIMHLHIYGYTVILSWEK